MKKTTNFNSIKTIVMALSMYVAFYGNANAQSLVNPSNSPTALVSGITGRIEGINTAMIQGSSTGSGPNQPIFALVYFDGSTAKLYIQDIGNNTTSSAISLSATPIATPDVIIGNLSSGVDDYTVVVTYADNSGNITIDYFDFTSSTSLSYPSTPTNFMSYAASTASLLNVRVDGIVDYASTGTTGYPYCRFGVVTFEYGTGIGAQKIDFDNQTAGFSPTVISVTGVFPDVAAIKRTVVSSVNEIALITYLSSTGANNTVYYREWDIAASTVTSATVEGVASTSNKILNPRIDAIDDDAINATTSGNAYYKIVTEHFTNSSNRTAVRTFDNLLGNPGWTSSGVINYGSPAPPYDHFLPTVAMGQSGTEYMVAHFTNDDPTGSGNGIVMMEPIDWTTSNALSSPNKYYWVSQSSATPFYTSASCVSSDCNDVTNCGLIAWSLYDGSTNSDIFYKITSYPYGFKPGVQPGTAGISKKQGQVYPNPASSVLHVNSTTSVKEYRITDVLGRMVLTGNVDNTSRIDISSLTPGNYIVKLYKEDGTCSPEIIVKE